MKCGVLVRIASLQFCFVLAALGAELQSRSSAPNSPPAKTEKAVSPEYRLGSDDVIEVFVWKEPDLTTSVVVRPDGKISLPLTGEIVASGRTALELQRDIAGRLREYVTNPVVNVIVKEVNSPKISVLGKVKTPGVYKMTQKITVIDAIALAGGFTDFAKRDRVTVIRNNGSAGGRIRVNVERFIKDGKGPAFYLEPFDTVYVE